MARKLCLIFIIILVLLAGNFAVTNIPHTYARTINQVTVSAVVLEQINYKRNNREIIIETNYRNGLWIISENNQASHINQKAVLKLPLEKNIIIVPKI